jgi:predicted transcriptional regulator
MSEATLEQRVTALELKVQEEVDRLYSVEFPAIDEQIHRAIAQSWETDEKATARVQAGVDEARAITDELSQLVKNRLREFVADLVSQSNSVVVANALRESLKNQILVVRQASREELKAGGALVVRNATREELHKKN